VQASYVGILTGDSLRGTFTQMGRATRLSLGRVAALPGAPIMTAPTEPTYPARLALDDSIHRLLAHRVDDLHRARGIVVAILEPGGARRVVTFGVNDPSDARALDGNTVFEIGSNTKVFTSLVLADMVRRGELRLDDPVDKYLPDLKIPAHNGHAIRLVDLAMHTSGLPRVPTNMPMANPRDPYADYTRDRLRAFLGSYALPRDPGAQYEYSNLGAGLLGDALAHRAGTDYETLVRTRVLGPLGLHDTRVTMADMLATRRSVAGPVLQVGLGWHTVSRVGHELVFHSGETGGFASFMGYDRQRQIAIVVWSNAAMPEAIDDLGLFLLAGGGSLYAGTAP